MPKTPHPHQIKMAEYALKNNSGLFHAEPRTGKTLASILTMKKARARKLLIVAPNNLILDNWKEELLEEGVNPENILLYRGLPKKRKQLKENLKLITLVTYQICRTDNLLHTDNWDGVILDEIHRIKDPSTKTSRYFLINADHLLGKQMRLGLTGTPASESSLNLVSQHLYVFGNFMGYDDFSTYYFKNWRYNEIAHRDFPLKRNHIQEMIDYNAEKAFCITMADTGLGSEIFQNRITIPMNSKQRYWLRKLEKRAEENKGRDNVFADYFDSMQRSMKERKVAAGLSGDDFNIISDDKAQYLLKLYQEDPKPMVIAGVFVEQLKNIQLVFNAAKVRTRIITGSTKGVASSSGIKDFQQGRVDILIGQIQAIEEGINLSRASDMYIVSESLSTKTRIQVERRIINTEKNVPGIIHSVCTEGTIDMYLAKLLQDKVKVANSHIEDFYLYKKSDSK